jgi:hypothetical protein
MDVIFSSLSPRLSDSLKISSRSTRFGEERERKRKEKKIGVVLMSEI